MSSCSEMPEQKELEVIQSCDLTLNILQVKVCESTV